MDVVFNLATMAMGAALSFRKRLLMTPRGLVSRRNGAEMALAGMVDCAILCDNNMRVLSLLESMTTRDCAEPMTFNSVSSENCLKCLEW